LPRYNRAIATPAAFQDHFSGHSEAYERYRLDYPPALYAWLAEQSPARRLAVDVATGNGQAAVGLAEHFDAVVGLEPSAEQLRQAAHWFDWQAFTAGARRVLRPGGVLAIWCYGLFESDPAIDRLMGDFSRDVVEPWWPRERRHVEVGDRELVPPFPAIAASWFAPTAIHSSCWRRRFAPPGARVRGACAGPSY
jgi:SAM-dependent methyltransferase